MQIDAIELYIESDFTLNTQPQTIQILDKESLTCFFFVLLWCIKNLAYQLA
jgi:hypothetical protein